MAYIVYYACDSHMLIYREGYTRVFAAWLSEFIKPKPQNNHIKIKAQPFTCSHCTSHIIRCIHKYIPKITSLFHLFKRLELAKHSRTPLVVTSPLVVKFCLSLKKEVSVAGRVLNRVNHVFHLNFISKQIHKVSKGAQRSMSQQITSNSSLLKYESPVIICDNNVEKVIPASLKAHLTLVSN